MQVCRTNDGLDLTKWKIFFLALVQSFSSKVSFQSCLLSCDISKCLKSMFGTHLIKLPLEMDYQPHKKNESHYTAITKYPCICQILFSTSPSLLLPFPLPSLSLSLSLFYFPTLLSLVLISTFFLFNLSPQPEGPKRLKVPRQDAPGQKGGSREIKDPGDRLRL